METAEVLAQKLKAGLTGLGARGPHAMNPADARQLADLATKLSTQLGDLPDGMRRLLHTADSGFASTGTWVNDVISKQDQAMHNIARGARVMSNWLGPNGAEAERVFLTRGHIRAWAHRWRTEDKGPAQVESDPEFVAFASHCLQLAGIEGPHPAMIGKALLKDWRTAE